jgi:hypothetical protein
VRLSAAANAMAGSAYLERILVSLLSLIGTISWWVLGHKRRGREPAGEKCGVLRHPRSVRETAK